MARTHFPEEVNLLDGLIQHGCIEVYLPKNLQNQGALIALLAEVLEFDGAKHSLLENAEHAYIAEHPLFELPQSLAAAIVAGSVGDELRQMYADNGHVLPAVARLVQEGSGQSFWVECECVQEAWRRIGRINGDSGKVVQLSPWSWQFDSWEKFRERIDGMKKRIFGYSIYEVDGAFGESDNGQLVPVAIDEVFEPICIDELKRQLREAMVSEIAERLSEKGRELGNPLLKLDLLFETGETISHKKDELRASLDRAIPIGLDASGPLRIAWDSTGSTEYAVAPYEKTVSPSEKRTVNYVLVKAEKSAVVLCSIEERRRNADEPPSFRLVTGDRTFEFVEGKSMQIRRLLPIMEERTLVLRFLVELPLDGQASSLSNPPYYDPTDEENPYKQADDVVWDALLMIGQYFVYHLDKVGIEDEIWIAFNLGYLWKWKHGKLLSW